MSNMTNEGVVELVKQSFDTNYVQQKNVKVSDNDLIDNLYLIVLVHCASYIDQEKLSDLEDSYKCLPHDDSRLFSHLLKKKLIVLESLPDKNNIYFDAGKIKGFNPFNVAWKINMADAFEVQSYGELLVTDTSYEILTTRHKKDLRKVWLAIMLDECIDYFHTVASCCNLSIDNKINNKIKKTLKKLQRDYTSAQCFYLINQICQRSKEYFNGLGFQCTKAVNNYFVAEFKSRVDEIKNHNEELARVTRPAESERSILSKFFFNDIMRYDDDEAFDCLPISE